MTMRTVVRRAEPAFVWEDVVDPTAEELNQLARQYGLQPTSVNDCLDPEHLPKFEQLEGYAFAIIRVFDERSSRSCTTVQELTRKIAIFYGTGFLLTVHRREQAWLTALVDRIGHEHQHKPPGQGNEGLQAYLLTQLLNAALDTYLHPLELVEARIDAFEEDVFSGGDRAKQSFAAGLREIHVLKRQVTLIKRLLWRTVDVVQRMTPLSGKHVSLFRDVQENLESFHFYVDEMLDDANTLLSIQLSLASHRTGEVMRVLTVFSVFFLPLTFVVGVYGMNFDFMPELHSRWGYPVVLAAMGLVTVAIYLWFRRNGWLRE
ncbi:MAG TPA: CorA family divalent cation transporter [Gemmatimonadales bacterium]|jgi:magnesium transporter|nr:CorA family divalent cation transporter [Gemmatimonadales bacterium]